MADQVLSSRQQQLQSLANSFPVANQQTANALEAGRQIQMQQAIGAVKPTQTASVIPAATEMGAQQVAAQGQNQLAVAQQSATQQQAVGKQVLENEKQGSANQQGQFQQDTLLSGQDLANKMAGISQSVKNQLVDQQMQFERDAEGRTVLKDRQLNDLALLQAKNQLDLQQYQQTAQQAWTRKQEALKAAADKIQETLTLNEQAKQHFLDYTQQIELATAKAQLEESQRRTLAKAADTARMFTAGGSVLGGVAGGVLGSFAGPAGTAAGASAGTAIGGAVGGIASTVAK